MRRRDVAAWVGCLALLGPAYAQAQAPAGANHAEHAKLRAEVIRLRTEVEMLQLDYDLARADLIEDLKLIKGMAMAGDLMSAFGGARNQAPAGDAKARDAEAKKEREDEKEREAAKASFVAERKKELARLAASLASKRLDLEDAERQYREPAAGAKLGAGPQATRPGDPKASTERPHDPS
jgi:hypothetical protein